jgi:hypothetical protein
VKNIRIRQTFIRLRRISGSAKHHQIENNIRTCVQDIDELHAESQSNYFTVVLVAAQSDSCVDEIQDNRADCGEINFRCERLRTSG